MVVKLIKRIGVLWMFTIHPREEGLFEKIPIGIFTTVHSSLRFCFFLSYALSLLGERRESSGRGNIKGKKWGGYARYKLHISGAKLLPLLLHPLPFTNLIGQGYSKLSLSEGGKHFWGGHYLFHSMWKKKNITAFSPLLFLTNSYLVPIRISQLESKPICWEPLTYINNIFIQ